MDLNFNEPKFTSADIVEVLNVSAANIQTWANRGVISPKDPNPGLGNRRLIRRPILWRLP